jgi:hypothetical protein
MIQHSTLLERLSYDASTGVFTWRSRSAICLTAGDVAGRITSNGYRQIKINYRHYLAHRLAWLYVHGEWPKGQIDHINGLRDDNRLSNLRDVDRSSNQLNRHTAMPNTTTGLAGVFCKRGKFGARIRIEGRLHYLGTFLTAEQAHERYVAVRAAVITNKSNWLTTRQFA